MSGGLSLDERRVQLWLLPLLHPHTMVGVPLIVPAP
jgi:hypothetical protein